MLVGPGIWRKCLPVCTVMGVLPGVVLLLRARITLFAGLVPRPDAAVNAQQARFLPERITVIPPQPPFRPGRFGRSPRTAAPGALGRDRKSTRLNSSHL